MPTPPPPAAEGSAANDGSRSGGRAVEPDVPAQRPARQRVLAVAAVFIMVAAAVGSVVWSFLAPPLEGPPAPPPPSLLASTQPSSGIAPTMPAATGATPEQWAQFVQAENARPGTQEWMFGKDAAGRGTLAGYADRVSILPGQPVGLYLTGNEPVTLRAFRMGWYGGAGGRQVWQGTATAPAAPADRTQTQPLADVGGATAANTVVAPWTLTTVVPTQGWPEGYYLFRLDGTRSNGSRYIPLTVRSASAAGRLTYVQAALTYQAYNTWGAYNLYKREGGTFSERATAVSFDRPYVGGYGSGQYLDLDHPIVAEAEKAGLPLAWVSDYDVALAPSLLHGAAGVVFGGHAEYWPATLRSSVDSVVNAGGNLAVFGANTGYWRVRMGGASLALASQPDRRDGRPRTVFGPKEASLDPLAKSDPVGATAKYRDAPSPLPEDRLMGQMYDCNPVEGDWVIRDPAWWGFEGLNLPAGTRLLKVVGNENDRVFDSPERPRPLQVVAHDELSCDRAKTAYTAVYGTRPSGAGIFSSGTLGWPRGFSSPDPTTKRGVAGITANVLKEFARAGAGKRRPAVDTVAKFWLPSHPIAGK